MTSIKPATTLDEMTRAVDHVRRRLDNIRDVDFDCVTMSTNPVIAGLRGIDPGWNPTPDAASDTLPYSEAISEFRGPLTAIVEQYVVFPRIIAQLLMTALQRARMERKSTPEGPRRRALVAVENELLRNIGQELGSESNGVTHCELLIRGLSAVGIRNARSAVPDEATATFTQSLRDLMLRKGEGDSLDGETRGEPSLETTLGAVYAMENTAEPELEIVRAMVLGAFQPVDDREETLESVQTLKWFFEKHLGEWEPSHHDYLWSAVAPLLWESSVAQEDFETGYRAVLASMEDWWTSLASALDRSPRHAEDYLRTLTGMREETVTGEHVPFAFDATSMRRFFHTAIERPSLFGQLTYPLLAADIWCKSQGQIDVHSAVLLRARAGDDDDHTVLWSRDQESPDRNDHHAVGQQFIDAWRGERAASDDVDPTVAKAPKRVIETHAMVVASTLVHDELQPKKVGFYVTVSEVKSWHQVAMVPTLHKDDVERSARTSYPEAFEHGYRLSTDQELVQFVWLVAPVEAARLTESGRRMLENLLSEMAAESWKAEAERERQYRKTTAEQAANAAHDVKNYTGRIHELLEMSLKMDNDPKRMAADMQTAAELMAVMSMVSWWNVDMFRAIQAGDDHPPVEIAETASIKDRLDVIELCGHLLVDVLERAPRDSRPNSDLRILRRTALTSDQPHQLPTFVDPPSSDTIREDLRSALEAVRGRDLATWLRGDINIIQNSNFALLVFHILREAIWNMRLPDEAMSDMEIGIARPRVDETDPRFASVEVWQQFECKERFEVHAPALRGIRGVNRTYGFDKFGVGLGEISVPTTIGAVKLARRRWSIPIRTVVKFRIDGDGES